MSLARLLEQADEPRPMGEASPLWHQAHAVCHGSRDDMWDWLEARYLEAAQLLIDMAAWAMSVRDEALLDCEPDYLVMDALLTRFAVLDGQAKDTT